jgi:uncharacterized protein YwbE
MSATKLHTHTPCLLLLAETLRPLCVSAANRLWKGVDIVKKPTASLEQILRCSVTSLFTKVSMFPSGIKVFGLVVVLH